MGRAKSRVHDFFKHRDNRVEQRSTKFFCKGQIVNILSFAVHNITVATIQLSLGSGSRHRQYVNQCMWLCKLYLQKHTADKIWPLGSIVCWSCFSSKSSDSLWSFLIFHLITPENNQRDFDVVEQEFRFEENGLELFEELDNNIDSYALPLNFYLVNLTWIPEMWIFLKLPKLILIQRQICVFLI